ncbi:MAG: zinc transporter ZntB [Parvularculaceae bacterium]
MERLAVEKVDQAGDFDSGPPFVFGFGFKDGAAHEMRWEEAVAESSHYDWIWLHLNFNNEEARDWIMAHSDIPPVAANALVAGETRPRIIATDDGFVINLRGVNLNEGAEPEDMVSVRLWATEKLVVSSRRRRLRAAQDIREELLAGLKIKSAAALVVHIAVQLTERMEPYVGELEDEIDDFEELILDGEGHGLRHKIAETRQSAVQFRRFIAPQRDALSRLSGDESGFFNAHARSELREIADRVTRMIEEIDTGRERAMVLQDQLSDQRAEEMNRNMMILSVVAAIFLPLGFLTGLLGINVGGMPGADNPHAFWIVVGLCASVGGALLLYFRSKDWL